MNLPGRRSPAIVALALVLYLGAGIALVIFGGASDLVLVLITLGTLAVWIREWPNEGWRHRRRALRQRDRDFYAAKLVRNLSANDAPPDIATWSPRP